MSWPPYTIPVARMPVLELADGQRRHPYIARMVLEPGWQRRTGFGTGGINDVVRKIGSQFANAPYRMGQGAIAFGYCPDMYVDPVSMIFLEPVVDAGDQIWLLNKFAGSDQFADLATHSIAAPFVQEMWVERNSWLWFIFDVLGIDTDSLDDASQATLLIPDTISDEHWRAIDLSEMGLSLSNALHRLMRLGEEQHDLAGALTHGRGTDEWEYYVDQYGRPPMDAILNTILSQMVEMRKKALLSASMIDIEGAPIAHAKQPLARHPFPTMKLTCNFPWKDWAIIGVSKRDHVQWTVHRESQDQSFYFSPKLGLHGWISNPASGSARGPHHALRQAELLLPVSEFNDWLDRSVIRGDLLYNDEPYQLLGEQPLFDGEARFKAWATRLGLRG